MAFKFVGHAPKDNVGVAIEVIRAGETVEGFFLEGETIVNVTALQDIPLGHKIALTEIAQDSTVTKYGEVIGKANGMIQAGEHVHVHNIKSLRQF